LFVSVNINLTQKKRGELTCCPFHSLRLSHCLSKSNRQRQSPRRYEKPYCEIRIRKHTPYPKGYNDGLQWTAQEWYNHTRDIYRC